MKVVKIVAIDRNAKIGAKGFDGVKVTYVNGDGKESSTNFLGFALDKKLALKKTIAELKEGDTVELTFEKKGEFYNVVDVKIVDGGELSISEKPRANKPFVKSSGGSFQKVDNSKGMRVGNALTNAVALIVAGKRSGSIVDVALEVIKAGEELDALLDKGLETKVVKDTKVTEVPLEQSLRELENPEELDPFKDIE